MIKHWTEAFGWTEHQGQLDGGKEGGREYTMSDRPTCSDTDDMTGPFAPVTVTYCSVPLSPAHLRLGHMHLPCGVTGTNINKIFVSLNPEHKYSLVNSTN